MAKLASLVVDLQLQSAELRKGLDEANAKIEAFAKKTESAASTIAAAFTFDFIKGAVSGLADFVKGGAAAADAMGRMAASAGMPVEDFSRLAFAAESTGTASEQLGAGLGKLSRAMAEAHNGGAEQAAMFRGLSIDVNDANGKLRSSGDVFRDIAQRFAETDDGAAKTALAIQIFGKSGAELIPLLDQGAAGLDAFGDAAERSGRVVTEEGAAAARRFDNALAELEGTGKALAMQVAQNLSPSMAALAEDFTNSKGKADAFKETAEVLATTVRLLASAGVIVGGVFQEVGTELAGIASNVTNLFTGGDQRASAQATGDAMAAAWGDMTRRLSAIWEKSGPGVAMQKDAEKAKPSADKYVDAIERAKKATEEATAALKAHLDLKKKLAEIDRDMAKRRDEIAGVSPTAGFSGLEDALAKFEQARKLSEKLRANASTFEDMAGRATKPQEKAALLRQASAETGKADVAKDFAERADRAAKAFQEMAKTASEASGKNLEEEAAARAALEKRFDDIDKSVQKKRDEAVYEAPTKGFASFDAALAAMAAELKEEAAKRAEAAAAERDAALEKARMASLVAQGKQVSPEEAAHLAALVADAHNAMDAAEAHQKLAERATSASDAFKELVLASQEVPQHLAEMLKPSGAAVSATMQGVETGAAAGPVGAVVGGLVGLLSQSKTFQFALQELETIFEKLSNSVGKLVEPLLPLLTVVADIAAGFGALFQVLSPVVEFVARPLFEVFKAFGVAVLDLVKSIADIINSFAHLFGGKGINTSGIDKALFMLESASYDSALAQQKVAEAATQVSQGLENVPSWYKVEVARFNAADPSGVPGSSGGSVITDNSTTTIQVVGVTDPKALADVVLDRAEERKRRRTGSQFDTGTVP